MQLQLYLSILRRFWLMLVIVPILVGVGSLAVLMNQPMSYEASARVMITQIPHQLEQTTPFPDFNLISSWQSSGFIVDDIPKVVGSFVFANDISEWLKPQGYEVAPASIQASLRTETFHRSVRISSQAASPELATKFVEGADASLQANGLSYWGRAPSDTSGLSVALLTPATSAVPLRSKRDMVLQVGIRSGLALAAVVGIAFLMHYLDDRLYNATQIEALTEMQVIGTIPKE